eukprot:scaffold233404_cov21-Tisochrysis_lutea.AAC.1
MASCITSVPWRQLHAFFLCAEHTSQTLKLNMVRNKHCSDPVLTKEPPTSLCALCVNSVQTKHSSRKCSILPALGGQEVQPNPAGLSCLDLLTALLTSGCHTIKTTAQA